MITHKNMLYNLYQSKAWRSDLLEDVDIIVAITALPLYHIFSLQSNCLAMMLDGGENILITNPRDFPAFVKELAKHSFVYITGVNTLFASLLNTPGFDKLDFSSLRWTIGGGMAVQNAVSKNWEKITGQPILQAYGLTETSPVVSCNIPEKIKIDTVGPPFKTNEVKIAQDGEILVKGENVMLGYWNMKKETDDILKNGWLHTGDIGEITKEGNLKITDRKKDIIITPGGDNISPLKIENEI